MIRYVVPLLAVFAALLAYAMMRPDVAPREAPAHLDVVLTEKGFVPDNIFLKKGGTITFSTDRDKPFWPASNLHPNHGIYPEFDPMKPLQPNETWDFTFEKAGDWGFHDHLRSYYVGTISVVE